MNPQQRPDDPVKHVVLLMFENHSFDQMLGCFKQVYADLAGVDPENPTVNRVDGTEFKQVETTERQMILDHPPYDVMKAQKLLADVYNALRANPLRFGQRNFQIKGSQAADDGPGDFMVVARIPTRRGDRGALRPHDSLGLLNRFCNEVDPFIGLVDRLGNSLRVVPIPNRLGQPIGDHSARVCHRYPPTYLRS
jgi:hypothetical protein